MTRTSLAKILALGVGVAIFLGHARHSIQADTPPAAAKDSQAATIFDDPLEPFVPRAKRGTRDEDRLRALALFAAGRVAEQKQDLAKALTAYQRAFRLDPQATSVLREIVPLAFNLDRQAEGVRYALILAERDPSDPILLRRLAIYLSETGDNERALKFYEQAIKAQIEAKTPANEVLLRHEAGRLYFMDRQYVEAARQFAEVVKGLENPQQSGLDPNMRRAIVGRAELTYQLFGEAFLEAGMLDEAAAAFEKANEAKADPPLHAYNFARIAARKKRWDDALAKLQTYLDEHQTSRGTGPYQLLADILTEQGRGGEVIERLEKLRADDAANMPLALFLAARYRQSGQHDRAVELYRGLIERNRMRPPLEAYVGLFEVYRQTHDTKNLLATLGDALARAGSIDALGAAGRALMSDHDTVRAILALAREQLANEPSKLPFGGRLAAAALALEVKDFTGAGAFFEAASQLDPSKASDIVTTWGLELFMAGQYADAVAVFRRGLAEKLLSESNAACQFYLAGALAMAGKTDEAIAAADQAAKLQPDSARFQSRAAWVKYHAKQNAVARGDYQALIERFAKTQNPQDVRDVLREARLALSNIALSEGNKEEAVEWLEQVLDEFPDDPGALNDLGYLWADWNQNLERALDMVTRAVDKEPDNHAYRDSLGWALFRLGRHGEAVAELRKAADEDEPDGVVLDHLGDALKATGDTSAALEAWRRAAAAFDKHQESDKAGSVREKIQKAEPPAR